jgi:uncharacterized tellurite resistance protein B-like protein
MNFDHNKNVIHFANVVRIAKSDDEITSEEIEMLIKLAKKYDISDKQFKEILKNPDSIPTMSKLELEERIERLYELLEMVEADREIEKAEVNMLKKLVTGLAFPYNYIDRIVTESIKTDLGVTNLDRFKKDIYKVLKM